MLCLVIFGIFDFGRAINYWLDANHLANEGARWVVVNQDLGTPLPAYLRGKADTTELRSGGTRSLPAPLQVEVCYPNGTDPGDYVLVSAEVDFHWLPFLTSVAGIDTSTTLTGTATMRLEQQPSNHPATGGC